MEEREGEREVVCILVLIRSIGVVKMAANIPEEAPLMKEVKNAPLVVCVICGFISLFINS